MPEYGAATVTVERWPGIVLDEYWVILYGQIGTVSRGELWLIDLPVGTAQRGHADLSHARGARLSIHPGPVYAMTANGQEEEP